MFHANIRRGTAVGLMPLIVLVLAIVKLGSAGQDVSLERHAESDGMPLSRAAAVLEPTHSIGSWHARCAVEPYRSDVIRFEAADVSGFLQRRPWQTAE